MSEFSQELIIECINCFKEEDNVVLTQEQAIEALEGFAGLFLAFASNK